MNRPIIMFFGSKVTIGVTLTHKSKHAGVVIKNQVYQILLPTGCQPCLITQQNKSNLTKNFYKSRLRSNMRTLLRLPVTSQAH